MLSHHRKSGEFFDKIFQNPQGENFLLATLGGVELLGSQKIEKYSDNLLHADEELNHAFLLQSLIKGTRTPQRFINCGRHYLKRCEMYYPSYQKISLVLERRALNFYSLFLRKTQKLLVKEVLSKIVADELKHFHAIHRQNLEICYKKEEELFLHFLEDFIDAF